MTKAKNSIAHVVRPTTFGAILMDLGVRDDRVMRKEPAYTLVGREPNDQHNMRPSRMINIVPAKKHVPGSKGWLIERQAQKKKMREDFMARVSEKSGISKTSVTEPMAKAA